MNRWRFLWQLIVAGAVLVLSNLAVQRFAANSIPRQLLRGAAQGEPATDLFLGNSTMAAGIDRTAFAAAKPGSRPVNVGLGSSSPVEHYLLYRQQTKHQNSNLYYGFLDTQLTDQPIGNWDTLVGNRSLSYYVEPEVAREFYAADSQVDALLLRLYAQIPMVVERSAIWANVERLRRFLGAIGMPKKETNRFGRAEDFALLEADPLEFIANCKQATTQLSPLTPAVAAIFAQAKAQHSGVLVVEMPMPTGHRLRYYSKPEWLAYRDHLDLLVRNAGGTFLDASDWVGDEGFADHLHLNAAGARLFSERLAHWVMSH